MPILNQLTEVSPVLDRKYILSTINTTTIYRVKLSNLIV